MKENATNITIRTAFSDDGTHRYYLHKVWNDKKPIPLIISKSAGFDDGVQETTTQTIISNNLYRLGYGGFCLCNLFSKINDTETDSENIKVINKLASSKDFKEIIICWGNLDSAKESVQEHANEIARMLSADKKKTILAVSDGTSLNCHPLSPMVRKHFELAPFNLPTVTSKEAEEIEI